MLKKMIRDGFERIDDNEEETFRYVLLNNEVLQICKTKEDSLGASKYITAFLRNEIKCMLNHRDD